MTGFPRTTAGGVSLPRLICGSNAMLGYSHISAARDKFIKELFDTPAKMAKVIEVFVKRGCDAFLSSPGEFARQALDEAEQHTGRKVIWISTPSAGNTEDCKRKESKNKSSVYKKQRIPHENGKLIRLRPKRKVL